MPSVPTICEMVGPQCAWGEVCPLQSDEAKVLPEAFVAPPLKGVVVVDGEGHVHLGHKGIHAGTVRQRSLATGAASVPSWGYFLWCARDACGEKRFVPVAVIV